jgi:hypothetical protein
MPDGRHEDEKFILNAMDEFSEGTSYWSATTDAGDPAKAWAAGPDIRGTIERIRKSDNRLHAWCVRGGQVYDGQDLNAAGGA